MRIVATITQPEVIRAMLEFIGLPARPPPLAPARPRLSQNWASGRGDPPPDPERGAASGAVSLLAGRAPASDQPTFRGQGRGPGQGVALPPNLVHYEWAARSLGVRHVAI